MTGVFRLLPLVAGLALVRGVAPARAHELGGQLDARGNYFQSLDSPALKFDPYYADR